MPSFRPFFGVNERLNDKRESVGRSTIFARIAAAAQGLGLLQGSAADSAVEGTPGRGMADQNKSPDIAKLRKLEVSLHLDMLERHVSARNGALLPSIQTGESDAPATPDPPFPIRLGGVWRQYLAESWSRLRKIAYVAGALGGVVTIALLALWWRLGSGPIELDLATPWLTAAIEENFGSTHQVEVGGTLLERDSNGRTALRMRDIVVRDRDGTVVASAPKAEVGVSSAGLITGRVRAERLSLVGAEMQVRIEPDSKVTVFAGNNKRPFVTASATQTPIRAALAPGPAVSERTTTGSTPAARSIIPDFAALLAWIDGLSANGLDGHELSEVGLKNGNLTVDDQRNGKQWTFHDIDLSLTRPKGGGVALTISSDATERPWLVRAAMTPAERGHRVIDIETRHLPAKDLMLAMRIGDGQIEPDMPVSARIRADIGPDGLPKMLDGRILMEKGFIVDTDEPLARIAIDRAEISLDWDAMRQALIVPFQVISGGNRITLIAQLDAPRDPGGIWGLKVNGGTVVLASAANDTNPLILNRVLLRLRVDPKKQLVEFEQGDVGNMEVGLAISGNLDYASGEPRLALGIAGNRMSVAAMKRLWPAVIAPKVRAWVEDHIVSGTVERLSIATNAPFATLRPNGPPTPDDGLAIEIAGNGAEIRPVEGLPSIRDVDMSVRITGRSATVNVGRGNIELSPGRRLAITNGVFEVPDTFPNAPPAKVRFRLDGSVPAAAELLALDRLREFSGAPIDPATSRGTLSAQVALGMPLRADLPPGSTQYLINLEVANFAAEKLVMGQKVEATNLKVTANNQGYYIRGDVKLNGVPAALDYRKPRGDADAEIRVQATLDDAGRKKLGFDVASYLSGPVPVKINGRVPAIEGDSRYAIDADLTSARIDRLLPGWTKPAGRPVRATFTLITKPQSSRFEDISIEGSGTSVKGTVEVDEAGDVISANLPDFTLSDGDKAMLRAERGPDGALRVMMRGDVYDGRGFVKSAMAGSSVDDAKQRARDVDIDIRLGTVAGYHGETLRGIDLRMSRRGGVIKSFTLNGKLGRDTPLNGDLRGRSGGRNVLYVETADAGAFFRFTDTYPKIFGGEMWIAMDPPTGDPNATQDGILNIRDFTVRGEQALERVAAGAQPAPGAPASSGGGVEFSRMRVEFSRSLGRFTIREGLVKGPAIGATAEGYIDYLKEDVRMRGTFVPFYGLNNMFGQIPIFGLFLGGGNNEGLVGLTYEVVGPPSAPVLRVNPISVVAPGLIRKFFEFPNASRPQSYAEPQR